VHIDHAKQSLLLRCYLCEKDENFENITWNILVISNWAIIVVSHPRFVSLTECRGMSQDL